MVIVNKYWLNVLMVLVLALAIYVVIIRRAPINMDEFSHYHPIICNFYPNNDLNVFREACGTYDLVLPGTGVALPLRTFAYSGSITALVYLPVYVLWQSPDSARMMGYAMVVLQAVIISRMVKKKFAYVLMALVLFFPYFYQMVIDTGMVQLYTTLAIFACFLMERWFETWKRKYILLLGLIMALLMWARLVNVFCFPALALIFVGFGCKYYKVWKPQWRVLLRDGVVAGLLFVIPTIWYLLSTAPASTARFPLLGQFVSRQSHTIIEMLNPMMYMNHDLMPNFLDPLASTERAFYVPEFGAFAIIYSVVLYGVPLLLLLWQVLRWWIMKIRPDFKFIIYFGAFAITVLFLFRSVDTRHYHHVMLAIPFLILAWGYLLPALVKDFRKLALFCAGLFITLNIFYYVVFPSNQIRPEDDPSKVVVHEILQNEYLSQNYFYLMPTWGMYYYQALYGPIDQSVLYIEDYLSEERESKIEILRKYPALYNRKFLFVVNKTNINKAQLLPLADNLLECPLTKDLPVWGIWMNTDNSELNPCR